MAVPFVTSSPDPEVPAKAQRRKFSAEDKKRILEDVERATGHGGIGAVLRREGIYSSTLYGWRKERDAAVHKAFSQKRGPRPQRNPLAGKTKSCVARISACRKSWRKPTSSSTFKKKWPSCWVIRSQRFPTGRSDHDCPGSTSSFNRNEAGVPGVVGAARDLVPAMETSRSFSCCPTFRAAPEAFGASAFRWRTVQRPCVPS